MKNYNWVVIGCGVIAHQLAEALEKDGRTLYGVANRTYTKAVDFAKQYHIDHVYEHIDDVFEDENVDIVYISTPHNTHRVFLEKALSHGKHVLCEKSITLNSDELNEAIAYAHKNHVVLGEAMTIYHMPIYKKLHEIVASGTLGPLRMVQMNFGSYKDYDMNNRFFNRHLAGGALLDIGVYALSFMRYFMSEKPNQILSQVKKAPTGVDEQVGILLMNDVGEMATIALTLHAKQPKRGMLAFDQGYIEVYEYPRAQQAVITYTKDGHQEIINCGDTNDALRYEVHDMEEAVASGKDMLHLDYTKDVMDMMTELRQSWHFTYPEEE